MGLFSGKISQSKINKWQKIVDKEVADRASKGKTCRNCAYNNGNGACTKWNQPINPSRNCASWHA